MSWINNGKYYYQSEYDYYATVQVKLKFNRSTDKDILAWIKEKKDNPDSSIQAAIKRLIREDINRSNQQ